VASPPQPDDLVLGVDGGGTHTLAWLAARTGPTIAPLGRGAGGPGNPRAAGFETAQSSIAAAITAAFSDAGLPPVRVAAACLGLSGAGRAEEQRQMSEWAQQAGIAARVRVTHDAETILAAADADGGGIALIAGTGSFAWGRDAAGGMDRAGGWGYLLGDEGSAYWIALRALRAAVRAADGRGQPTQLLPALLAALRLNAPEQLVAAVYGEATTREHLAKLAPLVFELTSTDGAAAEILAAAAAELAAMTAALARKLGLEAGTYTLAAAGSVLVHQPVLRERLIQCLRQSGAEPRTLEVVAAPVAGAVRLARRLAAESS
jgi:N-acetylglucosamine kinase-like BadF-type ATPase